MTESHEVVELVDLDHYDPEEFKLRWSVKWLIAKAFRQVPEEFREPFYRQDHVRTKLS